jgi:hypothetical protein
MELSAEQVRDWVESWSWRVPQGPQHAGMSGDLREWWSLAISRRADRATLQLDVNQLLDRRGSMVRTFVRTVWHESLCQAPRYAELVGKLNSTLRELFSEANIEPPRLACLLTNEAYGVVSR